jgi:hypothetical protein
MNPIIGSVPGDIRAQITTAKAMDNLDGILLYSRNTLAANNKPAIGGTYYERLRELRQLIINEAHEITICSEVGAGGANKVRLKDLLLSDNIVTTDKIKYFSRYLDGNDINAANPAVLRIKSTNNGSVIKYFDNANADSAKANTTKVQSNLKNDRLSSFKVAKTLPAVAAAAPNQGSQAEVPSAAAPLANRKFPGGYFSFTGPANDINVNSVLSQINNGGNNFGYGDAADVVKAKDNLRELLLNLYTFIYGFREGAAPADILNYIKTNLESIAHSKCYKEYLKLYTEKYTTYAAAANPHKFVCDVINDIIISVVRIAIYNIANVVKNKDGMAGANAAQIYTSIDIIGVILKNFSNTQFSTGLPIGAAAANPKYNIFLYSDAGGGAVAEDNFGLANAVPGAPGDTIYQVPRLCNYCILKIISIVLGNGGRYQVFREIPVKFLLTSVIYVLQYDEAFVFRILFGFTKYLGNTDTYKNYDYLFLAIIIKFKQYFEMYDLASESYIRQLSDSIKVTGFDKIIAEKIIHDIIYI